MLSQLRKLHLGSQIHLDGQQRYPRAAKTMVPPKDPTYSSLLWLYSCYMHCLEGYSSVQQEHLPKQASIDLLENKLTEQTAMMETKRSPTPQPDAV